MQRPDFEQQLRSRGGGLVSDLPGGALAALRERLGAADIQAGVILLAAPNTAQFRLVLFDQPPQLTRFLSDRPEIGARQAVARLRIRPPGASRALDDYSFTLGALSAPEPVRVSARDDLDGESFAVSEVPGLGRIEEIVDTAIARGEVPGGEVTALVVGRFGREIRIVTNVVSPRTEAVVEFDRTGAYLRTRQA
ncbi:hypothetical protein D5S18_27355 [Nocardia panacis]|uniref:Uncharacterized protein n=1 Tax=Nocardia panacis TaxID=2340916 RepID=A0A3A4KBC4_9NOCA|nr:hypothetical protein [Nocardia panacis]RJO70901.1 hypothetical protein D5S18_27355 [Nocardia panacis]